MILIRNGTWSVCVLIIQQNLDISGSAQWNVVENGVSQLEMKIVCVRIVQFSDWLIK